MTDNPTQAAPDLCSDCPMVGYPTDKTRCLPCPRRTGGPLSAAPPAPDADPRGGEREAFEADARGAEYPLERTAGGYYADVGTRHAWNGWKSRGMWQAALRPQPNAGVLTDSARAQAAAETPFATGIHTASREIASDVDTVADEKAPEKIAAIITKHLGAGAGLTLTEEERRFVDLIQKGVEGSPHTPNATTIIQLLAIITRLTPGEANHG